MFGLDRFKGAEELELDADTIDRVEAVAEEAARAEVAALEASGAGGRHHERAD